MFKLVRVSVICDVDVDKELLLLLLLLLELLLEFEFELELLIVDVGLELLDIFDDVFVVIDGVCFGGWDDCIIILLYIMYVRVCVSDCKFVVSVLVGLIILS